MLSITWLDYDVISLLVDQLLQLDSYREMTSSLFLRGLPVTTSLAELGFEALKLFEQVQTVDGRKTPQEWPAAPFAAEAERFELWAVNLGLFVTGHGSLDYRIREADRLAQTIKRFMKELMDSLAEGNSLLARDERSFLTRK